MPAPAHKPAEISPDDLADRTMELDMRWMQYEDDAQRKKFEPSGPQEEPTVVLDLTDADVDDILANKK